MRKVLLEGRGAFWICNISSTDLLIHWSLNAGWGAGAAFTLNAPPPPHRVNVGCGPAEERVLLTGLHAVADIYCENCKTTLGWKYVRGSMGVEFWVGYMMFDTYLASPRGIWGRGGSASPWPPTCIAPAPFGLGYLYSRRSGIPVAVGTHMSDFLTEDYDRQVRFLTL